MNPKIMEWERINNDWQHGAMMQEKEKNTIGKSYVLFESEIQLINFLRSKIMYKEQKNEICLPIKQKPAQLKKGFICTYQLPREYSKVMIFKRFYENKEICYPIQNFLQAVYQFSQGVKKLHQQDIIVGYLDWSNLLVFIHFQDKYKFKTTQIFKVKEVKNFITQKLVLQFSKNHTLKPIYNHFVPEGAQYYSKQTDVFAIAAIVFLGLRKQIPKQNSRSTIQSDGFKRDEINNITIREQLRKLFRFVLCRQKQKMGIETLCEIVQSLIKESRIVTAQTLENEIKQTSNQFFSS